MRGPRIHATSSPPVIEELFSVNGYQIVAGDTVRIVGDVSTTKKVVHVTEEMGNMINNGIEYEAERMKRGGVRQAWVVYVNNWWWSAGNLEKTNIPTFKEPKLRKCKPAMFDVEKLDV